MGVTNMRTSTTLLLAAFCLALVFAPISLAEDAPPAEEEAMPNPEEDGAKEMGEMDKDKDGKATLEEIKTFMKEKYYTKPEDLKDLENDDGKPATPEDIVKMIDRDATELIDELDKYKSKDLSLEEVVAQYKDDAEEPEGEEDTEEGDEGEGEGEEGGDEAEAEE